VFAWTDNRLSLLEVLVSILTGMAISSAYTIFQNQRMLHEATVDMAGGEGPSREYQVGISKRLYVRGVQDL
jgi:hypothetical protein